MKKGISYYSTLFNDLKHVFTDDKSQVLRELLLSEQKLNLISIEIEQLKKK